jgi:hypothetical protein
MLARPSTGCNRRTLQVLWITGLTGCSRCTPHPERGCNQPTDGVQRAQPRGVPVAPEPSREPSPEPPAATAPVCEAAPASGMAADGEPVGEFFAALGSRWPLTPTQRLKLTPAITAALDRGWTPRALAAFTRANASGVHSPYAVLAARLSPAELPLPPKRSARPPWCGQCDQTTRMLDFHGDAPRPCPHCKPPACTQQKAAAQTALTASIAVMRGRRALALKRPGGAKPSQGTTKEGQARCHLRPGPGLCSPVVTVTDGERLLRQPATSVLPNADSERLAAVPAERMAARRSSGSALPQAGQRRAKVVNCAEDATVSDQPRRVGWMGAGSKWPRFPFAGPAVTGTGRSPHCLSSTPAPLPRWPG